MDTNGSSGSSAADNNRPANAERQNRPEGQDGPKKRRRGSRGGKNRRKPGEGEGSETTSSEGRPPASAPARKPQIGDTRPAAPAPSGSSAKSSDQKQGQGQGQGDGNKKKRRRGGRGRSRSGNGPVRDSAEIDAEIIERRKGRERNGRPVGRYLMCVQVRDGVTQVAVMEGRSLIEHYVSRPADDVGQIHGNIYLGRVQNVLPGMEAAFVDISTPKNAVLYRSDVEFESDDVETKDNARIEQILRSRQMILCQVTKNPIGAKGARLTQEVSIPGRFVVLIPNSKTYGISKRLDDSERRRLRTILDRVKPAHHGVIVRTAAEHATEHELTADMTRLLQEWEQIEAASKNAQGPALLYREPELAVRTIREEFNAEYRGVMIDDRRLFEEVHSYVQAFNPELADRVEYFDRDAEPLSLFETQHVHEQLHKALDRKVWLPSGGSLIIEHTEALTVIDVNTGKNVGTSNLEQTVFQNNLEAAAEVAHQLRLRDIGGIIVIDFIDMEIKDNRKKVVESFRQALSRDKTRTQVFDISELGLVEMTRKRIGEGLITAFAGECPECSGRGMKVDFTLLD
jgi:ribonuclease E